MEHPIKVDDLGVPLFQETSIGRYLDMLWMNDTQDQLMIDYHLQ